MGPTAIGPYFSYYNDPATYIHPIQFIPRSFLCRSRYLLLPTSSLPPTTLLEARGFTSIISAYHCVIVPSLNASLLLTLRKCLYTLAISKSYMKFWSRLAPILDMTISPSVSKDEIWNRKFVIILSIQTRHFRISILKLGGLPGWVGSVDGWKRRAGKIC